MEVKEKIDNDGENSAAYNPHMENVAQSLIYALGYLNLTNEDKGNQPTSLVIGPYTPLFSQYLKGCHFHTPFAGQSNDWTKAGHHLFSFSDNKTFDLVLLQAPQQKEETDALIAKALIATKQGGCTLIAADNQAGGKSLDKRLANFLCPTQNLSKHKARVVWTTAPEQAARTVIEKAETAGSLQKRNSDGLVTQPGIFCWDKRDKGTEVLLKHLPSELSGKGADLGCGLGEIGKFILDTHPEISALTLIDHDQRALDCCKKNLENYTQKTSILWQDIPTQTNLSNLDFVVMNPPFHIGKKESHALGKAFLSKAQQSLRKGGILYLVANTHLPYEEELKGLFAKIETLAIENGFKIIAATK